MVLYMNSVQRIKEFWNERAIQYGANQEATLGEIAVKCLEINEINRHLDHGPGDGSLRHTGWFAGRHSD